MPKPPYLHSKSDAEPGAAVLRLRRPVDPPQAAGLIESAIACIRADDSILYGVGSSDERARPCYPPAPTAEWDNATWADQALRIADVLYRQMEPAFEPDYVLANLARYLGAFRHDPILLDAALSLLHNSATGALLPPKSALTGDWRARLLLLRTQ